MLKIVRSANAHFVLFTLSGHIDAEHAAELQDTDGIKFENCPAYLREWIAKTQDPG